MVATRSGKQIASDDNHPKPAKKSPKTPSAKRKKPKDELDAKAKKVQGKRFEFLLKKTKLFAHFMGKSGNVADDDESDLEPPTSPSKSTGSHRHMKSEKEEDEELLAHSNNQKVVTAFDFSPPYIENGEMRDYQIRGLNWMISLFENEISGILADEMGLGKTLQSISMLGYLKNFREISGPHIIIAPKSTLSNWMGELQKWCPSLKAICLIGEKEERKQFIQDILVPGDWDVCVTSYDMVLREEKVLKKYNWRYLIIDEAHRIKNEKAKLSEIVRGFRTSHRLLLTGTPLQNDLHELWALLNFLLPDVFASSDDFDAWFNTNKCLGDTTLVEKLHAVLRPFLLRRLKSEVEQGLLPKKETKVYIGLTKMQREWYRNLLLKDIDLVNCAGGHSKMRLGMILMHLRKCCNHPYLFTGAEPGPPYTCDEHLVNNSGKMVILDKLLQKLKEQGSRVLLFCQMTRMMDILEDYFFLRNYEYYRLDGNTPHEDRQREIDEFNEPGSTTFLYMLSTRAGGLGINLASADVVIVYDSDWNPQVDLQAIDRAHRIGQKKQVRVFRLITENTVDEKIIEKAEIKLRLDRLVIQQGRLASAAKGLNNKEMTEIIQYGASHVFASTESEITDEDIDSILEKGEAKTEKLKQRLDKLGDLKNFTLETKPESVYLFEGEDYRKKQQKTQEWIGPTRGTRRAKFRGLSLDPSASTSKEGVDVPPSPSTSNSSKGSDYEPPFRPPRPKQPALHDFQFFPQRLKELFEREMNHYYKLTNYQVPLDETLGENAVLSQQERQKKINSAEPLTEEEIQEKDELLKQGFATWASRHFHQFVNACEHYGRNNIQAISKAIDGKTPEDVTAYWKVFLDRYHELPNCNSILARIRLGEKRIKDNERMLQIVAARVKECTDPMSELTIPYSSKVGNDESVTFSDRFLLCKMTEFGCGWDSWPQIEAVVKSLSADTKCSLEFRTYTAFQLKYRGETLLKVFDREEDKRKEMAEKEAVKAKIEAEREAIKAQKEAEIKAEKARKEAEREAEKARKEAEREAEKARKEAERQAEKARKEAEREAEKARKEAEKEALKAKKAAEKKGAKTQKEGEKTKMVKESGSKRPQVGKGEETVEIKKPKKEEDGELTDKERDGNRSEAGENVVETKKETDVANKLKKEIKGDVSEKEPGNKQEKEVAGNRKRRVLAEQDCNISEDEVAYKPLPRTPERSSPRKKKK